MDALLNRLLESFVPFWPIMAVIAIIVVWYTWYVRRRLYFLPWDNLSNDKELDLGASFAEVFVAEVEHVRRIHEAAFRNPGLWNDRIKLPFVERSTDGFPAAIRHIERLGGPSWFMKTLGVLPLFAPPATVRGSIHRFGNTIRFQVVIENARKPWVGVRSIVIVPFDRPVGKPEKYPEDLAIFAHKVFLEAAQIDVFKSIEAFMHFTEALKRHLKWEVTTLPKDAEAAIAEYDTVLKEDPKNAPSLFNKAVILYTQYDPDKNQDAIDAFNAAVSCSSDVALRAQAFGGLANALCQKRQRHKQGDDTTLKEALRYAQRGYETAFGSDAPLVRGLLMARVRAILYRVHRWFAPARARAAIVKALAYATQVQAENRLDLEDDHRKRLEYEDRAIAFYEEATQLNRKFTVAYSNLGYMYLERAKGATKARAAFADLRRAKRYCTKAIRSDPSYHFAYDNLGNIQAQYAKHTTAQKALTRLRRALCYYQLALSQQPSYNVAMDDAAKAYVSLALCTMVASDEALDEDKAREYVTEAQRLRTDSVLAGGNADDPGKNTTLLQALEDSRETYSCVPKDCGIEILRPFDSILEAQTA